MRSLRFHLRRCIPAVVVATLLVGTLPWSDRLGAASSQAPPESAAAEGPRATDSVSALGRIEPDHGVVVLGVASTPEANNGAIVKKLLVRAGDDVTKGQLLAETDVADVARASVAVAQAELDLSERRADMAVGQEQEACSRADVAERTAARSTRLSRSGAASSEEADVDAGDAKALSASCAAAREATKAAASAVGVARARLELARVALERGYVRAPADGRVLRVIKWPGELVGPEGILAMGEVGRMYAVAEVYETDIGRVRKGQKATITSKAIAGTLTGVVDRIRLEVRKQDTTGTDPASRKDARIVEVEVLLDQPERVASLSNLQVEVLIHP